MKTRHTNFQSYRYEKLKKIITDLLTSKQTNNMLENITRKYKIFEKLTQLKVAIREPSHKFISSWESGLIMFAF